MHMNKTVCCVFVSLSEHYRDVLNVNIVLPGDLWFRKGA